MSEQISALVGALVNIRGPFALFAFLALVALVAFKTKQVPELFFGLLKEKLTREKFSQLLHRFMFYGFTIFIVLCAVSVVGQFLSYKIQAGPASKEAGSAEIQNSQYSDDQKQKALAAYQEGIADVDRDKIADAIKKLEESVAQIPTLSAHYTLAYLYKQAGDIANANDHAKEAYRLARESKDALAIAKADQLRKSIVAEDNKKHDCAPLVGTAAELPKGGTFCNDAPPIGPGLYVYGESLGDKPQFYKINVKQGQLLVVRFRTSEWDSPFNFAAVEIYDEDCSKSSGKKVGGRSAKDELQFKAPDNSQYYLRVFVDGAGAVYSICIL